MKEGKMAPETTKQSDNGPKLVELHEKLFKLFSEQVIFLQFLLVKIICPKTIW